MNMTTTFVATAIAALASPALAQGPLFLSLADNTGNGLPGLASFTDADAVSTSLDGSVAQFEFTVENELDAMHRLPNGNWAVSVLFTGTFGGQAFLDGDLVEIDVTTNTFVGTILAEGDFTNTGADISAVSQLPNGNYLLSTLSDNALNGTAFTDGDIIEWNPATGATSLFLAEADLFDDGDGDVYGLHAFADGRLLITSVADEVVSGTQFRDGDAFIYDPATDTASLYFSEDTFVGTNGWDIDALYVVPTPGALALAGVGVLGLARRRRA